MPALRARDVLLALIGATLWVALWRPGPLETPYWWDEADVYAPGSRWVAANDLNVRPGLFPDDYSRGHPPLLYLSAGAAFRTYGPGPGVGHLVVLPFTAVALAMTYLLGATLFGRLAGALAALLLGSTPLFLSIGNMLLPEVPLTAFAVGSLLALARGRLGVAALLGVLAVWTKETGIFAAAAVGAAVLDDARRRGELRRATTARRAAIAALPLVALVAFLVWQKHHAGYFVFPHHADLFSERDMGLSDLGNALPSLLFWHGRWIALGAAGGALFVLRSRVFGDAPFPLVDPPSPPNAEPARWRPHRGSVVLAALLLVLFNALFFAQMFWLERYALPAHPGILVLLAGALLAAQRTPPRRALAATPLVLACAVGLVSLRARTPVDAEEQTFAYVDAIATHRAAFADLPPVGDVLTPWPMQIELRYPYLGYVAHPRQTIHPDRLPEAGATASLSAVLFVQGSRRAAALRAYAREQGFQLRGTYQQGVAPPLELWTP